MSRFKFPLKIPDPQFFLTTLLDATIRLVGPRQAQVHRPYGSNCPSTINYRVRTTLRTLNLPRVLTYQRSSMSTLVLHQSRGETPSSLPSREHKLGPATRVLEQRVRQRLLLQRLERQSRAHSTISGHSHHRRRKRRAAGSASASLSSSTSGSVSGSTSNSPAPSEVGRSETGPVPAIETEPQTLVPKPPRRAELTTVVSQSADELTLKRKRVFSGVQTSIAGAPQLQEEEPRILEEDKQKSKKKLKKRKSASPDQTLRRTPDTEESKEVTETPSRVGNPQDPTLKASSPQDGHNLSRLMGAAAEAAGSSCSNAVSFSVPGIVHAPGPTAVGSGAALALRAGPEKPSPAKQPPKRKTEDSAKFRRELRMAMPSGSSSHKGLCNYGNSCYLNSVLQTLLHTAPLVNACLQEGMHSHALKGFDPVKALGGLAKSALFGGSGAAWPKPFYDHLPKPLRRGRQEDAHEFLRLLLEGMSSSLSPKVEGKGKKEKVARTPIQHIFGGRFRSRVTCGTCKSHSDTFDEFADVSVDIASPRIQTLADALGAFTKPDRLTGGNKYMCEKCKKRSDAVKRFTIHEAPEGVLTIQLKRFDWTGKKVTRPIKFPTRLDLSSYMSSEEEAAYELYGIVHHFGHGAKVGHYVASVREASGSRWVRMDDDYVSPYSLNTADPSAYILFYQRRP